MYQNKTLTCSDCGADFTFTAEEQEFYATHNLSHEPKRCRPCREKRKRLVKIGGAGHESGPDSPRDDGRREGGRREVRVRYKIVCNACGKEDMVPFQPKEGREVFCRSCYAERRK